MASQPNLVQIVGRELNGVDSAQLRRFVERLFAHDAGIEELTPSTRAAVARQCYEFFAVRDQPSKIRVTPAPGGDGIVVETLTSDAPFIVDSLIECFRSLGARVRSILHPIYRVARTADGHIASLERNSATEATESLVRADLDPPAAFSLEDIEGQVRETLAEVELATRDFETMTARALQICEETAPHRELIDVRDFLRWLVQGGFVFLGYRRYVTTGTGADARLTAETDADLGIMRERDHSRFRNSVELNETSAQRRKLFFEGAPLVITKVAVESHVHRRRPMDSVLVRRHAANGRALEFDNFVGLFTSKAYAEEAEHIPILRSKLRALLDAEKAAPGSHDYKELVETFNSFPKDELFRASGVELQQELRLIVDFREEHPARLAVLPDLHRGQVVALVVL
ncbi:MAG TPA: hypothetical protein VEJ86_08970, partial [Candidatus Binataceae bacterium]|nr:hypothetical protein [Candidatus Binataceae bacterium]